MGYIKQSGMLEIPIDINIFNYPIKYNLVNFEACLDGIIFLLAGITLLGLKGFIEEFFSVSESFFVKEEAGKLMHMHEHKDSPKPNENKFDDKSSLTLNQEIEKPKFSWGEIREYAEHVFNGYSADQGRARALNDARKTNNNGNRRIAQYIQNRLSGSVARGIGPCSPSWRLLINRSSVSELKLYRVFLENSIKILNIATGGPSLEEKVRMLKEYEKKVTSINIKLRELDPVTAADPRITLRYITNANPPIASTSASATNPNPTPPTTNPTPTSTSAKRSYASSSEGDHASKRPKN